MSQEDFFKLPLAQHIEYLETALKTEARQLAEFAFLHERSQGTKRYIEAAQKALKVRLLNLGVIKWSEE